MIKEERLSGDVAGARRAGRRFSRIFHSCAISQGCSRARLSPCPEGRGGRGLRSAHTRVCADYVSEERSFRARGCLGAIQVGSNPDCGEVGPRRRSWAREAHHRSWS